MLQGKAALITGGGTGIGRAIALALAHRGVDVALNYSRSAQEAQATREEAEKAGVKAVVCQANVADDDQSRAMVDQAVRAFGRLDILVNNAGVTDFVVHSDLDGLKDEYWDRVMDVNVKGMFHCCRAAAPFLQESGGCIVNITSVAGLTGLGSSIAYAASKAAAISLTKSLARVRPPGCGSTALPPALSRPAG